jgi:hypothetical protein
VRRLQERGGVLALEGERRALRIVLVIGTGRARGVGQIGELSLKRGRPFPARACSVSRSSRASAMSRH